MLFLALRWRSLIKTETFVQKFFNDEIQLSGDWRVALSEIIFPTKIQHVVNGDLIAYSLKGYEDSQRISSDANVISIPYSGEKFSLMTGNFDSTCSTSIY